MEEYPLQTAFGTPVNICFVSDEGYAEPLRTALYSLLCNRDKMRLYDILILYENFSEEVKARILRLAEDEHGVRIRFIDIAPVHDYFPKTANAYYTAAINYRLYLLDKMFTNYGKNIVSGLRYDLSGGCRQQGRELPCRRSMSCLPDTNTHSAIKMFSICCLMAGCFRSISAGTI